jgi:hypothetical protein
MALIGGVRHRRSPAEKIRKGMDKAVALGIFTKTGNKIELTSAGREAAAYAEKAISLFMRYILSERTSTFLTFILHVVLSFLKALFGLLSFSAGLLADAADNTMDTRAGLAATRPRPAGRGTIVRQSVISSEQLFQLKAYQHGLLHRERAGLFPVLV